MIQSFRHKGIEQFFLLGSKAGIQPKHAARLAVQLNLLDEAEGPEHMMVSGWRCHAFHGQRQASWAVSVNGNWRLTFSFEKNNAILVDYEDYH